MTFTIDASPLEALALGTATKRLSQPNPASPITPGGYLEARARDLLRSWVDQEKPDLLAAMVDRIERTTGEARVKALEAIGLAGTPPETPSKIFRPQALEHLQGLDREQLGGLVADLFPELV